MPITIGDIKLFSLEEVSETLGVTTFTLRAYISKGKLKARKMGGKFMISEDALREYFTTIDEDNLSEELRTGGEVTRGRAGRKKTTKEAK